VVMRAFAPQTGATSDSINVVGQPRELCVCCTAFTTYAVLVQQSGNAPLADAVLLGYLLGRGARLVKVDHGLKVFGEKRSRRFHQRVVLRTSLSALESGSSSCPAASDKITATC
jgi:hypothetical protein